jgi:hypothetical protein
MQSWTIRRKFLELAAAFALLAAVLPPPASATLQTDPAALERTMKTAFEHAAKSGWHFSDAVAYFSTVLDAGRAYELVRRDDPNNAVLKGAALDLAVRLNYDPLVNRDAAGWYVRLTAQAYAADPVRGPAARALLAKLDAEETDVRRVAADADADATANAAAYPADVEALLEQVDADVRAYALTDDPHYRTLALVRAAQPIFPIAWLADDTGKPLWGFATKARDGAAGYDDTDRAAARAMFSHRASAKSLPVIGHVLSHDAYLTITAPADEYFGQTKLSPLGVRNALARIGKYLDAGWGDKMTQETLYVVDSLDDWQHQYPRDYELPRLLLQTYATLSRLTVPEARAAAARVRRTLTVDYEASPEARSLLAS